MKRMGVNPRPRTLAILARGDEIAARFRAGEPYRALQDDLHCNYEVLARIVQARLPYTEIEALIRATKRRCNMAVRFRRGHVTWNKGLRGMHNSPATEFKPGCLRGMAARRWRPVGTVVTSVSRKSSAHGGGRPHVRRQRLIKTRNHGNVRGRRSWRSLGQVVWEREHGPLPEGWVVMHADCDSLNDQPGNLVAMSKADRLAWQKVNVAGFEDKRKRRAATARTAGTAKAKRTIRMAGQGLGCFAPAGYAAACECNACGYTILSSPPAPQPACPKCGRDVWRATMVLVGEGGRPILQEAVA